MSKRKAAGRERICTTSGQRDRDELRGTAAELDKLLKHEGAEQAR